MPRQVKIKIIDRGWKRIEREMKLANNSFTKIGLQENATNKEGEDLVEIAATNEFGDPGRRIPERSFIRSTTDEVRPEAFRLMKTGLGRIIDGKTSARKVLGKVGLFMETKIKKKITDLRTPPNAPLTIALKGSDNPLIDTGQLRQSIRHVETIQ